MRTKKVKQAKESIETSPLIIKSPKIIQSDLPIVLEIGSGKGKFITELADSNRDKFYVAMERDLNVCYRILEKQEILQLPNLAIIPIDAKDLNLYFKPNSIEKIYLNFSDPWPKARHHKRRLTAKSFLTLYESMLVPNGQLEFRTDHESLFKDSLEYLAASNFVLEWQSNDAPLREAVSEYELKKRDNGPIYGFIARRK
ncbi:MAG: tRNA (guanosine(46)-N7)-methyltransferase TrmB [Acholeplasma sp.]|nr:tRNA (guanosine(46)-N7)-methyltransferase TrmB [Acholeplasma sp.]